MVLALLAEPDDPVTGGLLRRLGAVETLGLLDTDTTGPGLGRVDGQVWRDRLTSPGRLEGLEQWLRMVEESGIATLIPGDTHWPRALDDLGERAPFVLFVRGATSFLARPLNDLVTVTGSRAASAYGEHVAAELAGDLANRECVLVAGGAYGVEAAVHRAVLAAGGDTIAVLAGGVDRPHPSGHRVSSPGFCGGSFIWLWWSGVGVGRRPQGLWHRLRLRRGGRARGLFNGLCKPSWKD